MNNLLQKLFLSEGLLGPTLESTGQGHLRARPSGCRRMSWGWFRGAWDNLKAMLSVDAAPRPRRHAPFLSRRETILGRCARILESRVPPLLGGSVSAQGRS